jgi:hypothetical protein
MSHVMSTEKSGWDKAIEETKTTLARVEAKARRLRTSIDTLTEARDAGELWPGTQSFDQKSEAATQC